VLGTVGGWLFVAASPFLSAAGLRQLQWCDSQHCFYLPKIFFKYSPSVSYSPFEYNLCIPFPLLFMINFDLDGDSVYDIFAVNFIIE
jgi:hypothetical protein